jgi:hypothetical protein
MFQESYGDRNEILVAKSNDEAVNRLEFHGGPCACGGSGQ